MITDLLVVFVVGAAVATAFVAGWQFGTRHAATLFEIKAAIDSLRNRGS